MTSLLGLPLALAVQQLQSEGYVVQTQEARCRKGRVGNDMRVLRVLPLDGQHVLLTYAYFQTDTQPE